jgi:hypothetical protein
MGQYANQPDFATRAVGPITPDAAINQTTFLDSAAIYVGSGGNLKVIIAGTVGPSTVTGFSSPGFSGSGGTGYVQGTEYDLLGGNGTALAAEFNVVNGAIVSVINITSGTTGGYLNGDLVTVDGGDGKATLRVVAAPGPPTAADAVEFMNIQNGSFVPVIVDYLLPATATAASDLVAIY